MLGSWKSPADQNPKCLVEGPASMNAGMGARRRKTTSPGDANTLLLWLPTAILANKDPVTLIATWAQITLKLLENLNGGEAPKAMS